MEMEKVNGKGKEQGHGKIMIALCGSWLDLLERKWEFQKQEGTWGWLRKWFRFRFI